MVEKETYVMVSCVEARNTQAHVQDNMELAIWFKELLKSSVKFVTTCSQMATPTKIRLFSTLKFSKLSHFVYWNKNIAFSLILRAVTLILWFIRAGSFDSPADDYIMTMKYVLAYLRSLFASFWDKVSACKSLKIFGQIWMVSEHSL